MKLDLPKQVESFFQVYCKQINGKYYYFPNIFKKLDNNTWEEVEFKDLPEGIKKYIKNEQS